MHTKMAPNPLKIKDVPFTKRYIYDLDPEVLDSLQLMYFDSVTHEQRSKAQYETYRKENHTLFEGQSYSRNVDAAPHIVKPRTRTKNSGLSDFEKYNRSRVALDKAPISEQDFNAHMDELSISGSEDEDSDDLYAISETPSMQKNVYDTTKSSSISFLYSQSPLVLFNSKYSKSGKCFGSYKIVLDSTELNSDPLKKLQDLNDGKHDLANEKSALFMIGGGHFAAAIISHKPISTKGNKGPPEELELQSVNLIEHKTFHRYTTRRKQGGSQSTSDNMRGKASSAGSSLRRYNEQALREDVRGLLKEWKPLLDQCDKIFIKANGVFARQSLISKDENITFNSEDPRIKIFPFTTKRPTTKELRRAWCELSYLKIVDIPKSNKAEVEKRENQLKMLEKSREASNKVGNKKVEEPEVRMTEELIGLLKKSRAPALIAYMKKNKVDVNFRLKPIIQFQHRTPTLLHYASNNGLHRMCQVLLINLKADPTILNGLGKTAYQMASDNQTKYSFELARFNLGDDYCDWERDAKVPQARSRDEINKLIKDEQNKEKSAVKKLHEEGLEDARKHLKQTHDQKFGRGQTIGITRKSEQSKLDSLSPQQKLRIMREQRARAAEARLKANK